MLNKEYSKITGFINGDLSSNEMKQISEQIKAYENDTKFEHNIEKKMKEFNANKAWDSLSDKIEKNKLNVEKDVKMYSSLRIAASIALFIGISIFGYFMIADFNNIKYSEINSGNDIKEIVLPDGSNVSLNRNSSIKFPEKFSKENRIIKFSGEAFFNITKNPKKPFVIKSNNAKVTVLGTSFNVKANTDKEISVTVKSGKVKLAKNKKEHVVLIAGEAGVIKNNTLSKGENKDKNFLSWKTKIFEYNGEKLIKVISDFNKSYNVDIILSDDSIKDLLFTSVIKDKPLKVALGIICTAHGLKQNQSGNKIILYKE